MTNPMYWRVPRLLVAAFVGVTVFGVLMGILVPADLAPKLLIIPALFATVALVYWAMDRAGVAAEPAHPVVVRVAKVFAALILGNWLFGFVNAGLLSRYVFVLPSGVSLPWPTGLINLLCVALAFWGLSEAQKRRVF